MVDSPMVETPVVEPAELVSALTIEEVEIGEEVG
jgi:hypothetical protein